MTVVVDSAPVCTTIHVGSRRAHAPGPLGGDDWEAVDIGSRREYVSETLAEVVPDAHIVMHGDIEVPCHGATQDELEVLDRTLALVPPGHLRLFLSRRPGGLQVRSTAGRGSRLSYLGGLNPVADYADTPDWDERQMVLITHGAFWQYRALPICPTVLHEIGHRMTARGEIGYAAFPAERARALRDTPVSRNPGREEALCNAYMYFLCWAATDREVHDWADGGGIQSDRITRDALRQCRAFRAPLLDDDWAARFAEPAR